MAEVPGRLVGDAEELLQPVRRHAMLGLAHDVRGHEPLPQREMRVLKDRADANAELIAARSAVELPPLLDARDRSVIVAARTPHAVGPTEPLEIAATPLLRVEPIDHGSQSCDVPMRRTLSGEGAPRDVACLLDHALRKEADDDLIGLHPPARPTATSALSRRRDPRHRPGRHRRRPPARYQNAVPR